MLNHFQMFAKYNTWANNLLYNAASKLSEPEYNQDCRVFFKSMNGTLNHILVADKIWMSRFDGEAGAPTKLNANLHSIFNALREDRTATNDRIERFFLTLSDEKLAGDFTYTPVSTPKQVTQKLAPTLAHFFNHQTHHRGQAHAMLTRLTGEAPAMDLIYFQIEVSAD